MFRFDFVYYTRFLFCLKNQYNYSYLFINMESVVENISRDIDKAIDRTKVCPVLVRVFLGHGRHNHLNDYSRGKTPANELQLYTWMDATLKELTSLIRAVSEDSRKKGTQFQFSIVFADNRSPVYRMRDIGRTCTGQKGLDDDITLATKKFQIGDFLDVSIVSPRGNAAGGVSQFRGNRARPY